MNQEWVFKIVAAEWFDSVEKLAHQSMADYDQNVLDSGWTQQHADKLKKPWRRILRQIKADRKKL